MIKSFKHKGLSKLFTKGVTTGVNLQNMRKLKFILAMLNTAQLVTDMDAPNLRLHELKGKRKAIYSVTVNGNWRVTFKFKKGNAYHVNYEDYH